MNEKVVVPDSIIVVTRVHMKSASSMPASDKVVEFVQSVSTFASHVLVCVGANNYSDAEAYIALLVSKFDNMGIMKETVTLLPIVPWGYFTTALNAAILFSQDKNFKYVLFQSLEFKIPKEEVLELSKIVAREFVLVAGPAMDGHEFTEGRNIVKGRTVPWNTCALWNLNYLALTGFPLIGDGLGTCRNIGGVEEVSAINLLQTIKPSLKAVLIHFTSNTSTSISEAQWHIADFAGDPARKEYHQKKMASKDERPAEQMNRMGIASGIVMHERVII